MHCIMWVVRAIFCSVNGKHTFSGDIHWFYLISITSFFCSCVGHLHFPYFSNNLMFRSLTVLSRYLAIFSIKGSLKGFQKEAEYGFDSFWERINLKFSKNSLVWALLPCKTFFFFSESLCRGLFALKKNFLFCLPFLASHRVWKLGKLREIECNLTLGPR